MPVPNHTTKTITEQILELEAKKERHRGNTASDKAVRLKLDLQIQELRDMENRKG
ncbi:MAG: hypothetical protein GX111_11950 [Clostridiales bacterium]|jgi:hypothetical protein|nr:hypothetical protein [Clostridiales bacterium]